MGNRSMSAKLPAKGSGRDYVNTSPCCRAGRAGRHPAHRRGDMNPRAKAALTYWGIQQIYQQRLAPANEAIEADSACSGAGRPTPYGMSKADLVAALRQHVRTPRVRARPAARDGTKPSRTCWARIGAPSIDACLNGDWTNPNCCDT